MIQTQKYLFLLSQIFFVSIVILSVIRATMFFSILSYLYIGCQSTQVYQSQFDGPYQVDILDDSTHFAHPVGFVTNQFSSKIVPIDLKFEIPLSDQMAAPFLRSQGISTGEQRQLSDIIAYENEIQENSILIQLFTIDHFTNTLLMVPYIYVQDGKPYMPTPTFQTPYVLINGEIIEMSSDDFEIVDILSTEATTEFWTFTYESSVDGFVVEGSRSGRQQAIAYKDQNYKSDSGAFEVYLSQNIQDEHPIIFEINTGIVEHDLRGIPISFQKHPTKPLLAVVMQSANDSLATENNSENGGNTNNQNNDDVSSGVPYRTWISIFSLEHQREVVTIHPKNSASFEKIMWDIKDERQEQADESQTMIHQLFFPDTKKAKLHQISLSDAFFENYENRPTVLDIFLDSEDSSALFEEEDLQWLEQATPEKISHIAIAKNIDDDHETIQDTSTESLSNLEKYPYKHLFAGTYTGFVYVFDMEIEQWITINPNSSESKGMYLGSPITGLDVSKSSFYFQNANKFGGREKNYGVIVTTFDGNIYLLHAKNGCVATSQGGPQVETSSQYYNDNTIFFDQGADSNPQIYSADGSGQGIVVNQCGGIVRDEAWTVTYQENDGNWLVVGDISAEQEFRAYENQRYQNDDGAISFTIVSGSRPSTQGDSFSFTTKSNMLFFNRLTNNSGQIESIQIPANPRTFEYTIAESDGGWDPVLSKQGVIIPVINSNIVIRIDIENWAIDAVWN